MLLFGYHGWVHLLVAEIVEFVKIGSRTAREFYLQDVHGFLFWLEFSYRVYNHWSTFAFSWYILLTGKALLHLLFFSRHYRGIFRPCLHELPKIALSFLTRATLYFRLSFHRDSGTTIVKLFSLIDLTFIELADVSLHESRELPFLLWQFADILDNLWPETHLNRFLFLLLLRFSLAFNWHHWLVCWILSHILKIW